MVRITNLTLPPDGDGTLLKKKAAKALGLSVGKIHRCIPVRQSIDARKKENVHYVMTVDVAVSNEEQVVAKAKSKQVSLRPEPKPYVFPTVTRTSPLPPVVVGSGPAGLLAALSLAKAGLPARFAGAGPGVGAAGQGCGSLLAGRRLGPGVQRPVWRGRCRDLLRWKAHHRHP